jgi:hypothetical protein
MKAEGSTQIHSDEDIGTVPQIGTEILDTNLPSELNFNSKPQCINPE